MKTPSQKVVFKHGNSIQELVCDVLHLRKEQGTEVMYVSGFGKIEVDQVLSVNGFRF